MNLTEAEIEFQRQYDEEQSASDAISSSDADSEDSLDFEQEMHEHFPRVDGPSVSQEKLRSGLRSFQLRRSKRSARQGAFLLALAAHGENSDSDDDSDVNE